MPRKKKDEVPQVEAEKIIEAAEGEQLTTANLMMVSEKNKVTEALKKAASDIVKVKVKVGTLHWEGGWYSKGDTFECSRQRALRFEPSDIEIVE